MEPEQPSPDTEQESLHEEPHLPPPTLWPIGFAIGIVVVLVGLVIDPELISSIGAAIAIVFGFLWARDATAELRGHALVVEPERRGMVEAGEGMTAPPADQQGVALPHVDESTVTRSRFLEGATLGLGGVIGGLITVPVAGFALLPSFLGQKQHKVDLGPMTSFPLNKWFITTFIVDPAEGEVSRRTAFIRNNGFVSVTDPKTKQKTQQPSFTIISNHCAHLGCPVQANGPTSEILKQPIVYEHTANGKVELDPVVPAGYGCPCHGGQYDTEGNRIAGPPVRALDRYAYEIDNGRLVLLSTYSVSHVVGTGALAKIYKYKESGPGEHVDGPEQWFYPLQPPHH
ncbi:MAG TPA: Rieske 2Fe-2S domain-containing protein [Gaiellaceae bacterium]|nr:Rieske 2Fe-2S domain-containing protein [Gaiellaceae bacterium]